MSRARLLARSAMPIALACAACTAPAFQNFTSHEPDDDDETTAPATTATTAESEPTTGPVLTSSDPDTTSTAGPGGTSGPADTGQEPGEPPTILDIALVPDPLLASGQIHVTVTTDTADLVEMKLDGGEYAALDATAPGEFSGTMEFYSAEDNGSHTAHFKPWREDLPGPEDMRDFVVDLPAGGTEVFWEAVGQLGQGYVAALALLPDGDIVEFGTLTAAPSRCYLRRRTPQGAWTENPDVLTLPDAPCSAVDLGIDDDGALYLLSDLTGMGDATWRLSRMPSFGADFKHLRFGNPGEAARALAMHPQRLAVCGTQPTQATDLDAMLRIVNLDESGITKEFDYQPPMSPAHRFTETPKDCGFAADTLVLAGEAYGIFALDNPNSPKLKRRFVLQYDISEDVPVWLVDADPLATTQSGIESMVIDSNGRYITGGYRCGYPCDSIQAELRVFSPDGLPIWEMDLAPTLAAPQDLAWSPAGYLVFTSALDLGPASSAFFVQAWEPEFYPALWSYDQNVAPTIHIANAIAIGEFGQIYTGGVGAAGYPAVAFING